MLRGYSEFGGGCCARIPSECDWRKGPHGRADHIRRKLVSDWHPRFFAPLFRTGKTDETAQTMLGPVAVLEALEKSLVKKSRVRVQL